MTMTMTTKPKSPQKKVKFLTYGCQMNVADSERMAAQLKKIGYENEEDAGKADLVIINTCCVRETAEEKIYGKIGELLHLKRENPALILGVVGCMAQKEGEKLIKRAPHIDFVLGTGKAAGLNETVTAAENKSRAHQVNTEFADSGDEFKSFARFYPTEPKVSAWLPIMQGCNNFCTYCIVPYVRGREYSRRPEEIVAEAETAAKNGCREITLLGQNVNSYGKEYADTNFADLLRRINAVENLRRVRFMTSHPKDLSDDVIRAMQEGEKICEHIHLPLQHGSDRILKAMNRRYDTARYRELMQKIRDNIKGAAVTTDIIVGFPGETDEDFDKLLDFIREMRFDAAFTFLYSPRSGTPAATMENQVPEKEKKARLTELMNLQNEISLEINEKLRGEVLEIMTEGESKNDPAVWTGRTRTNKQVLFPHGAEKAGDFIKVKITAPQTWILKGERLAEQNG